MTVPAPVTSSLGEAAVIALPATDGNAVDLAALTGRSLVIVYPWTGRPGHPNPPDWDGIPGAHGSTPELEGFRDRAVAIRAAWACGLFGLSRQTTDYQRELVGAARSAVSDPERCRRALRRGACICRTSPPAARSI